jgi:DNA-binding MarR family transcriptional regulator
MRPRRDWTETLTGSASVLGDLAASAVEPALASYGLGIGSFDLLSAIRAAGGRETLAQVAARVGIVPSSLTESIAAIERKGLVERLTSNTDRRVKRVMLTEAGERVLDRCLAALEACEDRVRQSIEPEEIDRAIQTLLKAREVLQADS